MLKQGLVAILLYSVLIPTTQAYTFDTAKVYIKTLYANYYPNGKYFYTQCPIDEDCSIVIHYKRHNTVAYQHTFSVEHVVPASTMADHTGCGDMRREDCARKSKWFRNCYTDLNNLYPSSMLINSLRSDMVLKDLQSVPTKNLYDGLYPVLVNEDRTAVEPPDVVKGMVARAYLHMEKRGCVRPSVEDMATYQLWDKTFPPSDEELVRTLYITSKTKITNVFITNHKLKKR